MREREAGQKRDVIFSGDIMTERTAAKEAEQSDISEWRGDNLLGFALMEVREEIVRLRKFENELES